MKDRSIILVLAKRRPHATLTIISGSNTSGGAMATFITIVGTFTGFGALLGFGLALFNTSKAVRWKRAELASSFLRDLSSNQELVFACRALDWVGGRLAVPETLRPLLFAEKKHIDHQLNVLIYALTPDLALSELEKDERIQIYRTAMDSFCSWISLVSSAIDRNLFEPKDVAEVAYWLQKIESIKNFPKFIEYFDYKPSHDRLRAQFRKSGLLD